MRFGSITELGIALTDLIDDQSDWSQATFGKDTERGPLGALKHLEKESIEARAAWIELEDGVERMKAFREEMADCFLLVLDASRRGGTKVAQLIEDAQQKMKKNKQRQWPKPTSDEPVEHVKEKT